MELYTFRRKDGDTEKFSTDAFNKLFATGLASHLEWSPKDPRLIVVTMKKNLPAEKLLALLGPDYELAE